MQYDRSEEVLTAALCGSKKIVPEFVGFIRSPRKTSLVSRYRKADISRKKVARWISVQEAESRFALNAPLGGT